MLMSKSISIVADQVLNAVDNTAVSNRTVICLHQTVRNGSRRTGKCYK